MNKPKTKNSNRLEAYLWEGEEILWQGRPNAPLWEYLEKKADFAERSRSHNLLEHPLIAREQQWQSCMTFLWLSIALLLSILVSIASFLLLLFFPLTTVNSPMYAFVIWIFAFIAFSYLVPRVIGWLNGLIEKRYVRYAITNKRVYVALRWGWLYLSFDELISIMLDTGEYGTNIMWHHWPLSRIQVVFPLFLGLNDFDVQQIIKFVQAQKSDVMVVDERPK